MINLNALIKVYKDARATHSRFGLFYLISCSSFIFLQLAYLNLRFNFLAEKVPFFYTRLWGEDQLAGKSSLFLIPAISIIISLIGFLFIHYLNAKFYKYGAQIVAFAVTFCHTFLTYSLFRIIGKALLVQNPLISLGFMQMFIPFLLSLFMSLLLSPFYVRLMEKWKIVTDPSKHSHPGMILKQPSARGGGLFFSILLLTLTLIFVPLSTEVAGILILSTILAIIGFLDDIQNILPGTKLKFLENPLIRLSILFFFVSSLYFFGIRINFLANPFNGFLYLTNLKVNLAGISIYPISWIFTTFWIVWTLNLLSWSNGVDGQYSGIIGIGLIVVAFLSLRFGDVTSAQFGYARLAFIAAGISLGLTRVTWHPSKIMWGFGAMSAGLVFSSISILVQGKVIASVLILLIPFLDAVVTFFRRLLAGKSPWKGDKEHLHHLLMNRGLSEQKVALFYWFVTALFGGLSLLSVDQPLVQGILMILGAFFFAFIVMSLRLTAKKKALLEVEK
jgi:UDP-GlcNAc:undecaprenyl-phosphate GlcNAc-1-phosphate transferase